MKFEYRTKHMAYQVGTDEAGYGPNFGPLTVCGTLWKVPTTDVDLYSLLQRVVADQVGKLDKIPVCDSKAIYKSGESLRKLETAVLAILYALNPIVPENMRQLSKLISSNVEATCSDGVLDSLLDDTQLPIATEESTIQFLGDKFREGCCQAGVDLAAIRCAAIYPAQFNRLVAERGNKAEVLSSVTLKIINNLRRNLQDDVSVVCDKHGGRNKYNGMINQYLTDQFVTIVRESRNSSQYHWRESGKSFAINFQAKGESFLPTAFSSMVAKYVREVSMIAWNNFWTSKIPGLRPTKGYPADAKRFKKDIAKEQARLGISDELIWRSC